MNASETTELRSGLAGLIASELPEATGIDVTEPERAGGGNSSENWFFDAVWRLGGAERRHRLVLRRAPASEIVQTTREDEFHLLRALAGTGLPVPRAFWLDRHGRWLKRPAMVLERCAGRDDRFLLTGRNRTGLSVEARVSLAREFTDALAQIHCLDIGTLDLPSRMLSGSDPEALLDAQERECLAHEDAPAVELRVAAWWLRDNVPPPVERPVLVHGDFRPANILVDGGRMSAILDWELAFIGDPVADLAWHLAPYYRAEHFIDGHWTPRDFIRRYEQASGTRVDPERLRYWIVFSHYKLAGMAQAAIGAFLGGDSQRVASRPVRIIRPMLERVAGIAAEGEFP